MISNRIYCVHGGLSPGTIPLRERELVLLRMCISPSYLIRGALTLHELQKVPRGKEVPLEGPLCGTEQCHALTHSLTHPPQYESHTHTFSFQSLHSLMRCEFHWRPDILWSDPEDMEEEWASSPRGVSFLFGEKVSLKVRLRIPMRLIATVTTATAN